MDCEDEAPNCEARAQHGIRIMSWSDLLPSFGKGGEKDHQHQQHHQRAAEKEHAKDDLIAAKEELIQQLTERIRKQQTELVSKEEQATSLQNKLSIAESEAEKWKREAFSAVSGTRAEYPQNITPASSAPSSLAAPPVASEDTTLAVPVHHGSNAKIVSELESQIAALRSEREKISDTARVLQERVTHLEQQLKDAATKRTEEQRIHQEDRKLLLAEIEQSRLDRAAVDAENQKYVAMSKELFDTVETLQAQLDQTVRQMLLARPAESRSIDSEIQKQFNLPPTEFVVESYHCMDSYFHQGWLYVTPNFVCFRNMIKLLSEVRIVFPIKDIETINKVRGWIELPPGYTIEITLLNPNGPKIVQKFQGFLPGNRSKVIQNILQQSQKLNRAFPIRILKNGSPDDSEVPDLPQVEEDHYLKQLAEGTSSSANASSVHDVSAPSAAKPAAAAVPPLPHSSSWVSANAANSATAVVPPPASPPPPASAVNSSNSSSKDVTAAAGTISPKNAPPRLLEFSHVHPLPDISVVAIYCAASARYLSASLDGKVSSLSTLSLDCCWELKFTGKATFVELRNLRSKKYLCAEKVMGMIPSGRVICDRSTVGTWERWEFLYRDKPGSFALRSAHGSYLTLANNTSRVTSSAKSVADSETLSLAELQQLDSIPGKQ